MADQSRLSTLLIAASLAAGVSYLFAVYAQMTGPEVTAWKGMGVGLLAVYAALCAKGRDGWILPLQRARIRLRLGTSSPSRFIGAISDRTSQTQTE